MLKIVHTLDCIKINWFHYSFSYKIDLVSSKSYNLNAFLKAVSKYPIVIYEILFFLYPIQNKTMHAIVLIVYPILKY